MKKRTVAGRDPARNGSDNNYNVIRNDKLFGHKSDKTLPTDLYPCPECGVIQGSSTKLYYLSVWDKLCEHCKKLLKLVGLM